MPMPRRSRSVSLGAATTLVTAFLAGCGQADGGRVEPPAVPPPTAPETVASPTGGSPTGPAPGASTPAAGAPAASTGAPGAGAASPQPQYEAYCVERDSGLRADDVACDDDEYLTGSPPYAGHAWYYIPAGTFRPAVGAKAAGGSYAAPSRGGLGGTASGGGAGG
jgi:hypothetical protein